MNTLQASTGAKMVFVLFGFGPCVQERLKLALPDCPGSLVIWYGGAPDDAFYLKDWWQKEIETCGSIEGANLVLSHTRQEHGFAEAFLKDMALHLPHSQLCVSIVMPDEGNFGHRTALKFRANRFLSRLEGVANLSFDESSQRRD
jgi:hypothetical protein